MKRIFLALTALIGLGSAVSAQNLLLENPDNKPYFGARLGLDVTSTAGETYDTYTNGAGFNVGAIYNIPVVKNFYFEPGISLFYNTFGQEIATGHNELSVIKESIRNFGFRVPFNFGYRFDFTDDMSIYVYTGPVLNLNLTAKAHFDGNEFVDSYSNSLMGNGFKRADMQWDFGVGYSYNKLYVQVGGGVGVTKVYSDAVDSFRRNTFNLAVGYNF
ncbi:MAG: porin family protein [Bacteroidales bacterium]|nr:porin family protein [Bacteroidales bacterium]MDE6802072.1 PorT family protein [Muribaculaceae bacterium]